MAITLHAPALRPQVAETEADPDVGFVPSCRTRSSLFGTVILLAMLAIVLGGAFEVDSPAHREPGRNQ